MASEFVAAGKRMEKMREAVPFAVAARYESRLHRVLVTLSNHLEIAINPEQTQVLQGKSKSTLQAIEILPGGYALYFPALDEGLYLPGIFQGIFGTQKWMRTAASTAKKKSRAA